MRVTVFGATGDQGAAQVRALAEAGHHPIAVSRAPKPLSHTGRAIKTAAADFIDDAAIRGAVDGADAIFLNLPSTSFQEAQPLIDATARIAEAAASTPSVRIIVFNTSLPVPEKKLGFAAQDARHDMRSILFSGGVPTISIQPVVFLDNLLKGWAWPPIATRDTIVYPHRPDVDVSWICHDDLAQLMIAAAARPHLAGRSFAVGGPETVRLPQLAEKLSHAWDRKLAWESQSIDAFTDRMRQVFEGEASLRAEPLMHALHRIYTWYNTSPTKPFYVDMAPVLTELPVTLTPIEAWGRRQVLPEPA